MSGGSGVRAKLRLLGVMLANAVPRTRWGVYETEGTDGSPPQMRFMIWRQWGLRVKEFDQFELTGWSYRPGLSKDGGG